MRYTAPTLVFQHITVCDVKAARPISLLVLVHHLQLLQILAADVEIAVAPDVATVAASMRSAMDHPGRDGLAIVSPADPRECIDEAGREI